MRVPIPPGVLTAIANQAVAVFIPRKFPENWTSLPESELCDYAPPHLIKQGSPIFLNERPRNTFYSGRCVVYLTSFFTRGSHSLRVCHKMKPSNPTASHQNASSRNSCHFVNFLSTSTGYGLGTYTLSTFA